MTDWLARKYRGVIDFSLPGDPDYLPQHIHAARIMEYYQQIKRHGEPRNSAPPAPAAAVPSTAVSQPVQGRQKTPAQGRLI